MCSSGRPFAPSRNAPILSSSCCSGTAKRRQKPDCCLASSVSGVSSISWAKRWPALRVAAAIGVARSRSGRSSTRANHGSSWRAKISVRQSQRSARSANATGSWVSKVANALPGRVRTKPISPMLAAKSSSSAATSFSNPARHSASRPEAVRPRRFGGVGGIGSVLRQACCFGSPRMIRQVGARATASFLFAPRQFQDVVRERRGRCSPPAGAGAAVSSISFAPVAPGEGANGALGCESCEGTDCMLFCIM